MGLEALAQEGEERHMQWVGGWVGIWVGEEVVGGTLLVSPISTSQPELGERH